MQGLINKLAKANSLVKNTKTKKKGRNTFSNYDYFTPDQVDSLVHDVCAKSGIFYKFDLIRDELGITGKLEVFDMDTNKSMIYQMASAIPDIKATNISQQLGGAMTYTKRYLLMNIFGITDNNLDFDTDKPERKEQREYSDTTPDGKPKEWLNEKDLPKVVESCKKKGLKAADMRDYYKISKNVFFKLEKLL